MANMTLEQYKLYVEELTGGLNGCQVKMGGTCHRPDIQLYNDSCDTCEFFLFCLCRNKKSPTNKKTNKSHS